MSRSIGGELPREVITLLGAQQDAIGMILLMLTTDLQGYPHVAQLSAAEIVVLSPQQLRVAVSVGGTTLRNIRERGRVTLAVVEPSVCCYAKGTATVTEVAIPPGALQTFEGRRVDVEIDDVLLDAEGGARVTTGPRYQRDATREEELSYWREIHRALVGE